MKKILGGACVFCGQCINLQIDHINPSTKSFVVTMEWDRPWDQIEGELTKCQLLCVSCHKKKTLNDKGQVSEVDSHGTLSSYRYCKCKECKQANNKYKQEYKKKRLGSSAG